MKKKGYYEYTPQIYPRKLWVMYNTSEEEMKVYGVLLYYFGV